MNKKIIEDALRKSFKFVRTVEAICQDYEFFEGKKRTYINITLEENTEPDTLETIEKALAELGIIV